MRPLICSILTLVVLVGSSTLAHAEGPATWDGNPPQATPPVAPIGGNPYGGAYGNPYSNPYGNPYGANGQSMFLYESQKKNAGIALLLEFLVPGVGSVYAEHGIGALVTWGLMIGGIAVIIWGVDREISTTDAYGNSTTNNSAEVPVLLGVGMVLAGRIYGFVDSYQSTNVYNRALAQRLGLPAGFALKAAPIRMDQQVAWGPALSFDF